MAPKLISIFFLLFALGACSRGKTEKGIEIFPDMVHSIAYEAYSDSEVTEDGKSMLSAPPNSIARSFMPYPYGKGEKEAIKAGEELVNPYEISKEALTRGKHVYDNYCLACHGEKGKGDGPLIPKFPNPPSLTSKRLMQYDDGRLFHIITRGSGDMPSHAAQILEKDRWYLVHYIKELQGKNVRGK